MTNSSAFEGPNSRPGGTALHTELLRRLRQHGLVSIPFNTTDDSALADLLSAIEAFEHAVDRAGGDLYIDSLESSEPERPEFVLPRPRADERIESYIKHITDATRRLSSRQ